MKDIKSALNSLFITFNKDFKDQNICMQYAEYLKIMCEQAKKYGIEKIMSLILEARNREKFFPSPGTILTKIYDFEEETAVNIFIQKFMKTKNNNLEFKKIDDDVYTVKKIIGSQWCENCLKTEEVFLRKAAIQAYKELREGKIKIQSDPLASQYIESNSCRFLKKENISKNILAKINFGGLINGTNKQFERISTQNN